MPAWLIAAFQAIRSGIPVLGRGLAGTPARALATGATGGALVGGIDFDPITGEPIKKRRRRRRALTQGDRNDIAFIAAIIGKTSAGSFAVQLATRSR